MSVPVRAFLKARRDRALGTILGYAERELWSSLTPAQQVAFRTLVIGAIDSYHDAVLDLVRAENATTNEEVVELLKRLDGKLPAKAAH